MKNIGFWGVVLLAFLGVIYSVTWLPLPYTIPHVDALVFAPPVLQPFYEFDFLLPLLPGHSRQIDKRTRQ